MAGPIRISILANASQARREIDSFSSSASRIGSKIKTGLAVGLGAGVAALTAFGKSAISAASDAEQSIGGTQAVFGKYSNQVIKDSNKAAQQFGLSANNYRESANIIGSLLKNQGVAASQLGKQTKQMVSLGSDLSATYGGTVKDAVDALASAFKGEFDPMQNYGVTLTQNAINMEAMRQAGVKSVTAFNKLSQAQQIQAKRAATTNLIMKQSGSALGQFQKQSDTLAEKQQILGARFDNIKTKIGTAFLPVISKLADYAEKKVVPALEDFSDWITEHQDDISRISSEVADKLVAALKDLASIAKSVVGFIDGIPGPIKKFGAEAVIAAVALGKLRTAMTLMGSGITGLMTNFRGLRSDLALTRTATGQIGPVTQQTAQAQERMASRTAALKGAVSNLAGVGGMVLLANGMQNVNEKGTTLAGTLETTLGGALTGLAVGGPLGALVGGGGGLLYSLSKGFDDADKKAGALSRQMENTDWAQKQKAAWQTVRDSLDQATGAYTQNTRAAVLSELQSQGLIGAARKLGISASTLVSATLGDARAQNVVADATSKHSESVLKHTRITAQNQKAVLGQLHAIDQLRTNLPDITAKTRKQRDAEQQEIIATKGLNSVLGLTKKQYAAIPKAIKSDLKLNGLPQTKKELQDFVSKYGKKSFATAKAIVKVDGLDVSNKELRKWAAGSEQTGSDAGKKTASNYADNLRFGHGAANDAGRSVADSAYKGLSSHSDTSGIGSQMASGLAAGLYSQADAVVRAAGNLVQRGMAAMRDEAEIRSPSKKTRKIGNYLSQGLTIGIRQDGQKTIDAAKTLIDKIVNGSYTAMVRNKQGKLVKKRLPLLNKADQKELRSLVNSFQKVGVRAHRAWRKFFTPSELRDGKVSLNEVAKAQARMNNALDNARQKLQAAKSAYNDYKSSVSSSITGSVNITDALSQVEGGPGSTARVLAFFHQKVSEAKTYFSGVQTLAKQGLSQYLIDQLVSYGPAGQALVTSLLQGGKKAITKLNVDTKGLTSTANTVSKTLATKFYQAGINAAQGLLRGLQKQQSQLNKIASTLANDMVKAIKKKLKIKSPSRVFRDIGDNVVKGLSIGLDQTATVKRQSVRLAEATVKGYGTPALEAYQNAQQNGSQGGTTYKITVVAPVGSSSADIGRELTKHINAYERVGGRRRA